MIGEEPGPQPGMGKLNLKPKTGPSPKSQARARLLFLKPDLAPKAKFTEWVKVCATAGQEKTWCTGVAAGTRLFQWRIKGMAGMARAMGATLTGAQKLLGKH